MARRSRLPSLRTAPGWVGRRRCGQRRHHRQARHRRLRTAERRHPLPAVTARMVEWRIWAPRSEAPHSGQTGVRHGTRPFVCITERPPRRAFRVALGRFLIGEFDRRRQAPSMAQTIRVYFPCYTIYGGKRIREKDYLVICSVRAGHGPLACNGLCGDGVGRA